jgi:outer membrane protein OmpA-like peptidoglycan-associated protein
MKRNPSHRLAIDGASDASGENLGEDRVNAVRAALIQAGVPAARIHIGDFGDPQLRRERRVEVLFAN